MGGEVKGGKKDGKGKGEERQDRNCFHILPQVWPHFDDGSCPGQGIGVRTRLDNGLSGFILTRNLSDKQVSSPEERVKVSQLLQNLAEILQHAILLIYFRT